MTVINGVGEDLTNEGVDLLCFFFFLIYLRDRENMQGRGSKRGGERIPSRLHTVSAEPDERLHLMNSEVMICTEIKSWVLNRLSHPGAPRDSVSSK